MLPKEGCWGSVAPTRMSGRLIRVAPILLLAVILFYRKPDALLNPQFWAEDGALFFAQAQEFGSAALLMPYRGYLHLVPRLVALVASSFPLEWAPAFYNFSALFITCLVASKILSSRVRVPSKPLFVLSLGLVPHSGEVFLNLTNVQWMMALLIVLLIIQEPPASKRQAIGDFLLLTIAALTGPFCLLFAPAIMLRVLGRRGPRAYDLGFLGLFLLLGLVQGLFIYSRPEDPVMVGASSELTWQVVAQLIGHRLLGTLFLGQMVSAMLTPTVLVGLTLVFVYGLACLIWRGGKADGGKGRMNAAIFLLAGASALGATWFRYQENLADLLPFGSGDRYFYLPRVVILWSILICAASRGLARGVVTALVGLSVLAGASSWFQAGPFEDYRWKHFAQEIERGKSLRIPINPPGWYIDWKAR